MPAAKVIEETALLIADLLIRPLSPSQTVEGIAVALLTMIDREPSLTPPETFDASAVDRMPSRVQAYAHAALALARVAIKQEVNFQPTPAGRNEALAEAYYIINALRRGLGPNHPREQRYQALHAAASANRLLAERMAREEAERQGTTILGHYGIRDKATTPDCAFLIGKNYRVDDPPHGLYPGGRHRFCRCWSGPPRRGAVTV